MPFLSGSLRRALPAAILFTTTSLSLVGAQQCYYPDGKTLATSDTPCDTTATASACCPSDSFCLSGGLCVAGGVISRGSCTDQTWGSAACAGYCKTVGAGSEIAITPCSTDTDSNTFACGLSGDCSQDTFTLPADTSLSLRPSQIAALVGTLSSNSPAISPSSCAAPSGTVSKGALAGVAVGVGAPLLLALLITILMLRREKKRFSKPKLMYKLPDDCKEEFTFRGPPADPPPPPLHPALRPDSQTDSASAYSSRRGSFRTATAVGSPGLAPSPRPMPATFMERYESMKKTAHGQTHEVFAPPPRHELDSTPPYQEVERHEMGDYRRSQSSQTMDSERR